MHVAFLNPQGNFDPHDRGWTEHPDFGGQLVYVKEVALALGELGCRVDIVTRRVVDPQWPEFAGRVDGYPGHPNVRILRIDCGPEHFLPKEELWPHLDEWKRNLVSFYQGEGGLPGAATGHYADGGLACARLQEDQGIPFTFTGHSLGAQKLDKLLSAGDDWEALIRRYHFDRRIAAERVSLARAGRVITSTFQERFDQYGHGLYREAVDPTRDEKFAVVSPGVNLAVFGQDRKNAQEEITARKIGSMLERDLPAGRRRLPVVICSSRLDRKKNHLALVRAWAVSEKLRESANLVMVVRGSDRPLQEPERFPEEQQQVLGELIAVIGEHDLWPCVSAFELEGQQQLAAAYRHLAACHRGVFALTAVYEPFGLAPLEAMAAGLAGVATRNGGPAESLQDAGGDYGVLVDPEDPEDIARGLLRLTADPQEWARIQQAGMRRVGERFTWEQTARGYLAQLEELLAGRGAENPKFPAPVGVGSQWLRALYAGASPAPTRS